MNRILLITLFFTLVSACGKNQDIEESFDGVPNGSYDVTPEGLVGRIDNKSEVARLEALAAEDNEDAMVRLYFHYADIGESSKLLMISERGASLGYKQMTYFLAQEYTKVGGNESCNKVIKLFEQYKKSSTDLSLIHKRMLGLGLIETDSGIKCDKSRWNFNKNN